MKSIFVSLLVLFCLSGFNSARACTGAVDTEAIGEELKQVALATLYGSTILSSTVSDISYTESQSNQTCPDVVTYSATVTARYSNGFNRCSVRLEVTKIEKAKNGAPVRYAVKGGNQARCQR